MRRGARKWPHRIPELNHTYTGAISCAKSGHGNTPYACYAEFDYVTEKCPIRLSPFLARLTRSEV